MSELMNPNRVTLTVNDSGSIPIEADDVLVDSSGGGIALTLPSPVVQSGTVQPRTVRIMKTSSDGNNVTVSAPGATLVGQNTISAQFGNLTCIPSATGPRWLVYGG